MKNKSLQNFIDHLVTGLQLRVFQIILMVYRLIPKRLRIFLLW